MKRCPECRRDYYDDTLWFCLDDGNALLEGPATADVSEPGEEARKSLADEPQTAILSVPPAIAISSTQNTDETELKAVVLQPPPDTAGGSNSASGFDKRLMLAPVALAVIVVGGFFGYRYFSTADSKQIESIAVMPFVNESSDAEADYLSDGMTDTLIGSLSQLANLKVKARSSVFRYKGKDTAVKTIGKELNVQAILNGRVVQRGDQLTLTLELINAETENVIWSERYVRKLADIFALQSEIAKEVSAKLSLKLSGNDQQQLARRPTENLKAFQYYTQGRSFAQRRTKEDLLTAISYCEKAIAEDKNYALAYAGLAEAYGASGVRSYISPAEGRKKAEEAARKALQLDENLAEAHAALALSFVLFAPHDFESADRELRRALELSPSLAVAHLYTALSYTRQGRFDESIEEFLKAREFDPLSPIIARSLALPYLFKRDYPRTLEIVRQAEDIGPAFIVDWEIVVFIENGLLDEGLAKLQTVKLERKDDPILIQSIGMVYAAQGRRAEALQVIKELETMSDGSLNYAHFEARIFAELKEKDSAMDWLERGLDAGQIGDFFKDEPVWDPLRDSARFKIILQRMGYNL